MREQVLTISPGSQSQKGLSDQEDGLVSLGGIIAGLHLDVKHVTVREAVAAPQKGQRSGSCRAGSKRRKPKAKASRKGGWPMTAYIDRETFRRCLGGAGILAHAGYPFTVMVTVRPPAGETTDADAKKHIELRFARLAQALERHGHDYIGLKVFEKKNGRLHGHMPLHIARECLPVVERWADRFDRKPKRSYEAVEGVDKHARLADHKNAMLYALKQHRHAGPFERPRKFYEKGEPFRGQRVTFTPTAKAIIDRALEAEQRQAQAVVVQIAAPTVYAEPQQLGLPLAAPVIDIRPQLEAVRTEKGLSQGEVARELGCRQPHYSNSVVRMHDHLSPWSRNRALEFLRKVAA